MVYVILTNKAVVAALECSTEVKGFVPECTSNHGGHNRYILRGRKASI
jgi:hypothetical protein